MSSWVEVLGGLGRWTSRAATWGPLAAIIAAAAGAHGQQFPTNNDPARQIRFATLAEAEARREHLIQFIWSAGLPTTLPTATLDVELPSQAIGVNPANISRVDRLDANVSGWDFHAYTYVLRPANPVNANRVAIVHQGHANTLEAGVGAAANFLLQNGFTVAVMQMPLYGWNTDKQALIPGRGYFTYDDHGEMIAATAVNNDGRGFRLFLEPVVQSINYFAATMPQLQDIGMVGLSGGGWTTSLMAAADRRIKLSAPVAGSAPLYRRNADPASVGDPEQYYAPLYSEAIAADGSGGGAATWLEIYALGGLGADRRQIQVTNEFDTCCFAGTFADSYKAIVAGKVSGIAGQWSHVLDSTHQSHQISAHIIDDVVGPLFGIENPAPAPGGLPLADDFGDQPGGLPTGWSLDPTSGGGATAVESDGRVTVSGPGLASIVRTAPLDLQPRLPVVITAELANMSADNFGGVFVTDVVGSRPHHVGVLINRSTRQIALNADNGNGFSGAGDRVILGTLPGYAGGAAKITLEIGPDGYAVDIDAGAAGRFSSGRKSWSTIPNGFDVANLGKSAHLFVQSFDLNGGAAASMTLDAISVDGRFAAADFNSDSQVDGADLLVWQRGFGASGGAQRADGDADGDGDVDAADLQAWRGVLTAGGASAGVPEPPSVALMLLAAAWAGRLPRPGR